MMIQLFSSITPPNSDIVPTNGEGDTIIAVLNLVLKLVFFAAGLVSFWNFISAGYIFIGSGGDSKSLESARNKIIWTFVGLLVMVSAVVIAGLIGMMVYGKWDAIINPQFTTTP